MLNMPTAREKNKPKDASETTPVQPEAAGEVFPGEGEILVMPPEDAIAYMEAHPGPKIKGQAGATLSPVGQRIRVRRKELNLSQRELAEKTQTSQEIISNYEQNITPIRVNDLERLCRALRVSMSYFFHEGQWEDDYVFAENGDHKLHDAEKENELLTQYRKLTKTSQNMVIRMTNALALQEKELNG